MFNQDFFPTPDEAIERMLIGIDTKDKVFLDPSAGKGNIVDYITKMGGKVLCCEKNEDLAKIVQGKADFLGYDFLELQRDKISHVDYIIMNPPFSKDEQHILHAWEIAPEGCQIVSLCNWETLHNDYSIKRKQLIGIINDSGFYENLGNVFSSSERKTDAEIGLINLFKPKSGEDEFEGYFDMTHEEERQENGIIQYNEIREIVNRYVAAVKMFDDVYEVSSKINNLSSIFSGYNYIRFGAYTTSGTNGTYDSITRDTYKKELQKAAWKTVFARMKMDKYVTQSLKDQLNKFVEKQTNVPFTMKNVYKMIDMIIQTHSQRMDKAILEVFDSITKHYHENRYNLEGWKTNSHYMLNKKMIIPGVTDVHWGNGGFDVRWDGYNVNKIDDLVKSLCYLTGDNYDAHLTLKNFVSATKIKDPEYYRSEEKRQKYADQYDHYEKIHDNIKLNKEDWINKHIEIDAKTCKDTLRRQWGTWYDWSFFRIKGYKKGTLHMEFKDEKVWMKLNRKIAELKEFPLPEKL